MGAPTSKVGYTSATTRRRDHEVHVLAWGGGETLMVNVDIEGQRIEGRTAE
jgi:hypothetical protein